MPFVAVGLIAAGAAVSAGVGMTTIAMVGLGATVVGKITKSKELMQLGSGIGLGAGIASVASGIFGGASAAAGTAEAAGSSMANTISSADLAGIDAAAGGIGGAAGAAPGAMGEIATGWDSAATALDSAGSAAGSTSGTGLIGSSMNSNQSLSGTPQLSNVPSAQPQAPSAATTAANSTGSVPPPTGTDSNSISQWWSKQSEATKNRILQMGGSAVGGLFDGWTAEQKAALERERLNLEQQKVNTATANGNAQPIIRFQQYKPAASGLLGSTKG